MELALILAISGAVSCVEAAGDFGRWDGEPEAC